MAIRKEPVHRLVLLFLRDSSEYAQYSYLFFAAPLCSACICYSYGILSADLIRSVFSIYVL